MTPEQMIDRLTSTLARIAERLTALIEVEAARVWDRDYVAQCHRELRAVAGQALLEASEPMFDNLELYLTCLRSFAEDIRLADGTGTRREISELSVDRLRVCLARLGETLDD